MNKPKKFKKERICAEKDEIDAAYQALLLHEPPPSFFEVGDIFREVIFDGISHSLICYDHVERDGVSYELTVSVPNGIS